MSESLLSPRKSLRQRQANRITTLADQGVGAVEIARDTKLSRQSIWSFLTDLKSHRESIRDFTSNRADLLSRLQGEALDLQLKVMQSINKDEVLATLKQSEKTSLLMALNVTSGTAFDKERLERGQSTENISVVSKMLQGVTSLHKRMAASKQPEQTDAQANSTTT